MYDVSLGPSFGRMKSLKTTEHATNEAALPTSGRVYRPRERVGRERRRKVRGMVLLKVGRGGELKVRERTRRW